MDTAKLRQRLRKKKDQLVARFLIKHPRLFECWVDKSEFLEFKDSPWTPLGKPIKECKLAFVTTGGIHTAKQHPYNMNDPQGDPTFREIPADTLESDLRITHNYYDHRDADEDVNIVFPIGRLSDLKSAGDIGDFNYRSFSFMGHIIKKQLNILREETAPRVAELLKKDKVDIVILTPT